MEENKVNNQEATITPPVTPQAQPPQNSSKKENGGGWKGCCLGCAVIIALIIIFSAIAIGSGLVIKLFSGMNIGRVSSLAHFNPYPPYSEEFVTGNSYSKNKIVVLDIKGVILESGASPYYMVTESYRVCQQIRYIMKEPDIKAVILDIESPGGEVVASDSIHHYIAELRKNHNVPVIASMRALGASGAYYIAAGCDHIIANRMTMTGSIGVIIQTYKYYDLFKKIGLQSESFVSGNMKNLLDGSRPTSPAERMIVQELVNNTYNEFVKIVAEGRKSKGLTVSKIKSTKIGDGRIFDGEQALKLGLVDSLGFFDDAVKKAAQLAKLKDYKVVRYQESFSFYRLFRKTEASSKSINLSLPGGSRKLELEKGKMYFLPPAL